MLIIKETTFFLPINLEDFGLIFNSLVNTKKQIRATQTIPVIDEVLFKPKHSFNGKLHGDSFEIQYTQHNRVSVFYQMIWKGKVEAKDGGLLVSLQGGVTVTYCILALLSLLILALLHIFVIRSTIISMIIFYFLPLGWAIYKFPGLLQKSEQGIVDSFMKTATPL